MNGKQLLQISFDAEDSNNTQIRYDAEHNLEGAAQFLVMFIKNTPAFVDSCRAELRHLEEGDFGTLLETLRCTSNCHNREVLCKEMQSILRVLLTV